MLSLPINKISHILKASLVFPESGIAAEQRDGVSVIGVQIDSRKVCPGQLFVAIQGEHHDGHCFLAQAWQGGASAALVSRYVADVPLPQIIVSDTVVALGVLARWWRNQCDIPFVAVTGSSGKTTVKNMIGHIFLRAVQHDPSHVLMTEGNFNNHIGLPLTLLQLSSVMRYAVIEMGMNHFNEITYLTQLTRPKVAVITNAMSAHLAGVGGTLAGVAQAKGEIFSGLQPDGVAVINNDDAFNTYWRALVADHRILSFGLSSNSDVYATEIQTHSWESGALSTQFQLHTPAGTITVTIPFIGTHNVYNALAAAACALALGISHEVIAEGLATTEAAKRRMQLTVLNKNGAYLVDDTYNANPDSVKAALQTCMSFPGEKILVLGDMLELGPMAQDLHVDVMKFAKSCGFSRILSFGSLTAQAISSFGENGFNFTDKKNLMHTLENMSLANTLLLVKGSLSMRMDEVVVEMINKYG